jgi:stringent starvation protein B
MSVSTQDTPPSTRPYLIRALHEWCSENGFSPYVAVQVDALVQVPMEFVKNGEIVLNVSLDATSSLRLGNDFIEFKARFGGVTREIVIPIDHVIAIYARENGQGMAFPAPPTKGFRGAAASPAALSIDDPKAPNPSSLHVVTSEDVDGREDTDADAQPPVPPGPGSGPKLRLIK